MNVAHVHLEDGGTFNVRHENDDGEVEFMRVTSSKNFVAFNRASWLRFVQTFRNTPSLRTICIAGEISSDPVVEYFSVEPLIQIIEAVAGDDPTKITRLSIICKTLTGVAGLDDGWERLHQCIQLNLRGLEAINIGNDITDEIEEHQHLEPLMQTIFSLPTLQWVELGLMGLNLSSISLQNLGQCQGLKQLEIPEVKLKDDQIMALSNALHGAESLDCLHVQLSSRLANPSACGRAFSGMLQGSSSIMVQVHSRKVQDKFHLALVDTMTATTTRGNIDLTYYCKVSEKAINAYTEMAKGRYNLTSFWCNIEDLSNDDSFHTSYKTLLFYVALNRIGRAKVMSLEDNQVAASQEQWIDLIAKANEGDDDNDHFNEEEDCLSMVFYLLSHNPLLCDIQQI